ncbi:carbohydrate ABC transporter permease [Rossellomorea sp. BNER]|uniref:carbohydrate ABC transporter permease n=1 Tax=Rossellomorea sp. BNER TaxID=2962031 RepID=UPI003AF26487|nr:carbohydrate ABC transporter permease [Rossellomorea sp. BNER]
MSSVVKETNTDKIFKAINYAFLLLALLLVLYPLIYIISASVSNPSDVNSGEMWLFPKGFTLDGYKLIFENDQIWRGYLNTIIYTVLGTAVNLLFTLPAAYALSRKDLVGRNIFMGIFVFTMFFSGGLIPSYLLVKNLGMLDTIWAMILPNAVAVWNLIVARVFFQVTIPKELEEAAVIDGCTNLKMFVKIVLPLSTPIIAVMALFYGVGHWNGYFNALIYLSDKDLFPLQLVLREILVLQAMSSDMAGGAISSSMAEAQHSKAELAQIIKYGVMIVSTLPIIIVYPFLQRYFVKGVMIGSVKG